MKMLIVNIYLASVRALSLLVIAVVLISLI